MEKSTEKKYLKWYNKVGYGAGSGGMQFTYGLLNTFVLFYMTNVAGLEAGILGTLMMLARVMDGFSDVIFGNLIDHTHSRWGKARPWMFWSYVGNAVCLVALFGVPESLGESAKYVYFFITYVLLNVIFYTINNISYAALTSLCTRNRHERVQMGSYRFMFATAGSLLTSYLTIDVVERLGGGAIGWRNTAILYGILGFIVNTISVLSIKELPEEETETTSKNPADSSVSLWQALKILIRNKYYLIILLLNFLANLSAGLMGINIYFMTYVLGDANLLGTFSMASMIPMILGLAVTPSIVKKVKSIYKTSIYGYIIALAGRILVLVGGYMRNVPMMLVFLFIAGLGSSGITCNLNALIAETSDYLYRTTGKRMDGAMFSCSSVGIKVGSGIGTALCGWLLSAGGFVQNAAVQPDSCINMIMFLFLWVPVISFALILILLPMLTVEKANAKLQAAEQTA